jgi:biopolymer transport protein ExbD
VINLPSPQDSSNTSATAQPVDYVNDPSYIVVTIDEEDRVWVEEEEVYGEQGLRSKLRAARQEDDQRTGMLVIGDPDATHGTLVGVLDAGADVGITELLFSVSEQPEEDAG